MFSFFKRSEKRSAATADRLRNQAKKPTRTWGAEAQEPVAVPQAVEGNQDSDWALWEDSVLEQDSQMHSLPGDTRPSRFSAEHHADTDADPFAQVNKHAP